MAELSTMDVANVSSVCKTQVKEYERSDVKRSNLNRPFYP